MKRSRVAPELPVNKTYYYQCTSTVYMSGCNKQVALAQHAETYYSISNKCSMRSNLNTYLSDRLSRSCVKSASHVFFDHIFFIVHLPLVITHFRSLFYSNIITPPSVEFLQTLMCDYLSMWLSIYLCP